MTVPHVFDAHTSGPAPTPIVSGPSLDLFTRSFDVALLPISVGVGNTSGHVNECILNSHASASANRSHEIDFSVVLLEVRISWTTKVAVGVHLSIEVIGVGLNAKNNGTFLPVITKLTATGEIGVLQHARVVALPIIEVGKLRLEIGQAAVNTDIEAAPIALRRRGNWCYVFFRRNGSGIR